MTTSSTDRVPAARPTDVQEIVRLFLCWYIEAYPEREWLSVADISRISDGWETDVYALALVYAKEGAERRDDLILRLYQGPDAAAKAAREYGALRQLFAVGYPVPCVGRLTAMDSSFGRPAITTERIVGRSLGRAIATAGDGAPVIWRQFARLFADLHALDWRPFVSEPARYRPAECNGIWLAWLRETVAGFELNAFDPLLDWLGDRGAAVRCERLSVVHGDFHPNNVLLRDDGTAVVIDWTQVDVSDFRFDLAWTLLLVAGSGHPARHRPVLEEYERQIGRPVEDLDFFEVAAGLKRLAAFVISLTRGPASLGMRPGAEEQMRRQLPHFRAVYALLRAYTGCRLPEVEPLLALPD